MRVAVPLVGAQHYGVPAEEAGVRQRVERGHRVPPGRQDDLLAEADGLATLVQRGHALATRADAALEDAVASRRRGCQRPPSAVHVALPVQRGGADDGDAAGLRCHVAVAEQRVQTVDSRGAHGGGGGGGGAHNSLTDTDSLTVAAAVESAAAEVVWRGAPPRRTRSPRFQITLITPRPSPPLPHVSPNHTKSRRISYLLCDIERVVKKLR